MSYQRTRILGLAWVFITAFGFAGCASTLEYYHDVTTRLDQRIDRGLESLFKGGADGGKDTQNPAARIDSTVDKRVDSAITIIALDRDKPKRRTKPRAARVEIAAPTCYDEQSAPVQTTALQTMVRLRLRSAPSIDSVTIRIFQPNTVITARTISCGNWTEVFRAQTRIGYVYSSYLAAPDT